MSLVPDADGFPTIVFEIAKGIWIAGAFDGHIFTFDRVEGNVRSPATDLLAELDAVLAGGAEVDAGVNARSGVFLRGVREALERPRDPGKGRSAGHAEGELVVAEEVRRER